MLLISSCKNDAVAPVDLTGDWQSEEIRVNGKLQEDSSTSTWLLLKKDNLFLRNYIPGTWALHKGKLVLTPDEELTTQPLQYEIIHLSDASLTLKITLTENEYFQDFEDIEEHEQITVTEKYRKR